MIPLIRLLLAAVIAAVLIDGGKAVAAWSPAPLGQGGITFALAFALLLAAHAIYGSRHHSPLEVFLIAGLAVTAITSARALRTEPSDIFFTVGVASLDGIVWGACLALSFWVTRRAPEPAQPPAAESAPEPEVPERQVQT